MGFSLLAPLFLGGLSLLAVPWILHQIRRPEREPVDFSSLMFVPDIKREVIERRRIQHILLMLLRMLVLLLIALAFTRPAWLSAIQPDIPEGSALHLILLDTSYSMGTAGRFENAKDQALRILDDVRSGDKVGVIGFSQQATILAPLWSADDSQAGSQSRAREAIQNANLTEEGTAYLPVLQKAQAMLAAYDKGGRETVQQVIHLVSDFQQAGMPSSHTGWKLPSRIELDLVDVETEATDNYAIVESNIRSEKNGVVRLRAKIRNESLDSTRSRNVTLHIDGQDTAARTLSVKPGNASQISFQIPHTTGQSIQGWLQLDDDDLQIDNRRYFTWTSPRKKQVIIVSDAPPGERWPATWFLTQAIQSASKRLLTVRRIGSGDLVQTLQSAEGPPDILILCDCQTLSPSLSEALISYIRQGGNAVLALNESTITPSVDTALFEPLGFHAGDLRYTARVENQFNLLSWIDFEHPVFLPFQGAQYNDFSTIRFFNYIRLESISNGPDDPNLNVKTLARFEEESLDEGAPAILDIRYHQGRAIVWAFTPNLDWSDLPKNPKFLPLVFETLAYLGGSGTIIEERKTGDRLIPPAITSRSDGHWLIQRPGETALTPFEPDTMRLEHAGFLQWQSADPAQRTFIEAVNIRTEESNPARIPLDEFRWKFHSTLAAVGESPIRQPLSPNTESALVREYGRFVIGLLTLLFAVEIWYASSLSRRREA